MASARSAAISAVPINPWEPVMAMRTSNRVRAHGGEWSPRPTPRRFRDPSVGSVRRMTRRTNSDRRRQLATPRAGAGGDDHPTRHPGGWLRPPSFGPPTVERAATPTEQIPVVDAAARGSSGGGRSRGKIIAAAVGAVAIVGAGVFAITRISGDAASGGASSPEAAANDFLDAIDDEDVLGHRRRPPAGRARDVPRAGCTELVGELTRLEVLSDEAEPVGHRWRRHRRSRAGRSRRGRRTSTTS